MRTRRYLVAAAVGLELLLVLPAHGQSLDTGVIRLGPSRADAADDALGGPDTGDSGWGGRHGFDYDSFQQRFESFWFRRKALLAEGRLEDAHRQSELIRSFCSEEGVRRMERAAAALVAEASRYYDEGSYEKALASLDLAEILDPGRPQIHFARAALVRHSGGGSLAALRELAAGIEGSFVEAWNNWTLINHLAILAVVAMLAAVAVFSLVMTFKYNTVFRHEVEEAMVRAGSERFGPAAGWGILLLPLLTWFLAGWTLVYWIVLMFRFMRRMERLTAVMLLLATAAVVPAFKAAVGLYGMTTDPAVRTTLESVSGAYSPDRLVKLQELAEAHPDDPVYHFLLAGLYSDGRYFQEAYGHYREVLKLDPGNYQARVNIGNIYYRLGQYGEAITAYRDALDQRPDSVLAHYNLYLAQSESFRFKEAEASLRTAQQLDPELARELLSRDAGADLHSRVEDAAIHIGSVWRAAVEGRPLSATLETEADPGSWRHIPGHFLNVLSLVALAAILACGGIVMLCREQPAGRCIRCGRPFCHLCRSGREGQEYCSQCVHLFVIGDGLAPETKTRKLYEVERYERSMRRGRRLFSLVLPGASHLLRGGAARGSALVFLWVLALIAWSPVVLAPVERLAGLDFHFGMLRPGCVPSAFAVEPSATWKKVE